MRAHKFGPVRLAPWERADCDERLKGIGCGAVFDKKRLNLPAQADIHLPLDILPFRCITQSTNHFFKGSSVFGGILEPG